MSKLTSPASGRPPRTVRRGVRFRHVAFLFLAVIVAVPVAMALIPTTRWADGTGYVMTEREVEIRPSVEGAVEKRLVHNGSLVKKGQLLVQLKASVQQAGFERAENQLKATEAELARLALAQKLEKDKLTEQIRRVRSEYDNARTRLAKMKKAAGGGFSQQEIDDAQLKVDVAQSRLTELALPQEDLREKEKEVLRERILARKKEIDLYEAELELRRVRAALDGTVWLHSFEPGEVVKSDHVLGQIFDQNAWIVKIKLPERHVVNVAKDQPVRVELAARSRWRYGYAWAKISRVFQVVTPQATGDGIFYAEARIENTDDLPLNPGMTAQVRIDTGETSWLYRLLGW